jgi:hypothetical protein
MLTIIHGDDIAASRKYFFEQKKDAKIPVFDGGKLSLLEVKQYVQSGGLFGKENGLFIENFIIEIKPGKTFDEIVDYLKTASKETDIYLWERKELTKKQLSEFGNAIAKLFKIPQTTFAFLDSIKPGSGQKNVMLFQNTLKTSEPEAIMFMLIRQFRLLLALSDANSKEQIDEVKRLATWQIGKLQSQAKSFSQESLINIYKKLYEIDLAQKTGGLTMPLTAAIDFFLLDI